MSTIRELFRGKKVYILGGVAIIYGTVGFFMGLIDTVIAQEIIWAGFTAMGLRAGISNG